MRSKLVLLVVVAGGCEKNTVVPRYEGPMPVTYGDCAGPTIAWVSGPRPAAFTSAEAAEIGGDGPATAAGAPPAADTKPATDTQPAVTPDVTRAPDTAGVLGTTALTEGGAFASLTGTGDISSDYDDTDIYGGLVGDAFGEMNGGGFGMGRRSGSGTGSPQGGTNSRYGTIGHGSGGYGIGVSRGLWTRRHPPEPRISIGQPVARGDLDKAITRRFLKRNGPKLLYCYQKELMSKRALSGTVTVKFFITPNGDVARASASGVDANLASCVAGIVKSIVFPKPKGGGVEVDYPITFEDPGAADAIARAAASSGSRASSNSTSDTGSAVGSDAGSGSGSAQTAAAGGGSAAAAPAAPAANRRLFRTSGYDRAYKPGALNPLRASDAALVECFRRTPVHHGIAVFELAYDAAGKVQTATVHGLDDKRLVTCVTSVAKRATRASPTATTERCAVAFGEMPVASLPTLDIRADAIALGGTTLADPRTVFAADGPSAKIPVVSEAIATRVAAVTSRSAPPGAAAVVSLHGPLLVRPIDATPMKVVSSVLASILAAGDDFVLATQAAGGWSLLTPLALPVVPVPFGTGGEWSSVKGRARTTPNTASDVNRVELSILITKDAIWLGISRLNEFVELKRDANVEALLQAALGKHKASALFTNRTEIEIAAEDAVTYADYVGVVRAAVAAGFVDWKLAAPSALAARPQL